MNTSKPKAYPMNTIYDRHADSYFAVCMCPLPMGVLMNGVRYSYLHKVIPNSKYICEDCGQIIMMRNYNKDQKTLEKEYPEDIIGYSEDEFNRLHDEYLNKKEEERMLKK